MKKLLFVLLISASCFGQTPFWKLNGLNLEEIYLNIKAQGSIGVSFYRTPDENQNNFVLRVASKPCERTKGVVLLFTDGSVLRFPEIEVFCMQGSENLELTAAIPMTDALREKMASGELTSFTLGKTEVPVKYSDKFDKLSDLAQLYKLHLENESKR
ncbi:MAG: hypothetical protein EOO50_14665 [Flavobacterium sp.]|uniref:hypothetical protein n=1 Tax=Flavobacterium sp. TaxID=239 RepID=UPI00120E40F1|nr:hypothetical protein [Flavobacterium sp.]RZJ65204.1 MAG: hypothetical protein EOO50_14665 [Flavobacterium sp.]